MANPKTVYEQLIDDIADEDERKIFTLLLQAGGQRVTRAALAQAVYGGDVAEVDKSNSTKDRKVREIIRRLRERDYPIVSSSDAAGYTMQASEEEMDSFIKEQGSRLVKLQANIDHAYRSKKWIGLVREYRERSQVPQQLTLMETPRQ